MKLTEAKMLKKGDLVIIDERNKYYRGLVLEVENIVEDNPYYLCVDLKQPEIDSSFRIKNYDSRHLIRYESD